MPFSNDNRVRAIEDETNCDMATPGPASPTIAPPPTISPPPNSKIASLSQNRNQRSLRPRKLKDPSIIISSVSDGIRQPPLDITTPHIESEIDKPNLRIDNNNVINDTDSSASDKEGQKISKDIDNYNVNDNDIIVDNWPMIDDCFKDFKDVDTIIVENTVINKNSIIDKNTIVDNPECNSDFRDEHLDDRWSNEIDELLDEVSNARNYTDDLSSCDNPSQQVSSTSQVYLVDPSPSNATPSSNASHLILTASPVSVRTRSHNILVPLPHPFDHVMNPRTDSNLELALAQKRLASCSTNSGIYACSWLMLLPLQQCNVLKDFGIDCEPSMHTNRMSALLMKSVNFTQQWGKGLASLSSLKFLYSITDPWTTTGVEQDTQGVTKSNAPSELSTVMPPSAQAPEDTPTRPVPVTRMNAYGTTPIKEEVTNRDCLLCGETTYSKYEAIGCDGDCKRWYHTDCVNLTVSDVKGLWGKDWFCTQCKPLPPSIPTPNPSRSDDPAEDSYS